MRTFLLRDTLHILLHYSLWGLFFSKNPCITILWYPLSLLPNNNLSEQNYFFRGKNTHKIPVQDFFHSLICKDEVFWSSLSSSSRGETTGDLYVLSWPHPPRLSFPLQESVAQVTVSALFVLVLVFVHYLYFWFWRQFVHYLYLCLYLMSLCAQLLYIFGN